MSRWWNPLDPLCGALGSVSQGKLLGLAAPSLRWQTSLCSPDSNDGQASGVAENGEDGSSWLSACALFMFLVNWPAADCSGEIAVGLKYTSSSHTARRLQVSARSPVSFCFHSSLRLRRPGLNISVFLMCIRLNYAICNVLPVHSCVSAARFLFFLILNL